MFNFVEKVTPKRINHGTGSFMGVCIYRAFYWVVLYLPNDKKGF